MKKKEKMLQKLKRKIAKNKTVSWQKLENTEQWKALIQSSRERPVLIFKHSTRCSLSSMAKNRLERSLDQISARADLYILDLINYRSLSDQVAIDTQIRHESPQVLMLSDGHVTYHNSHNAISAEEILSALEQ